MQPDAPLASRRGLSGPLAAFLLGLVLAGPSRAAEEALPLDTLAAIKKATVYLKVQDRAEEASGTGFVVAVNGATVYVVTNDHVIDTRPDVPPGVRRPPRRTPVVTAVFGSGTANEQVVRADIVASAPRRDLAVLAVRGLRDVPRPLDLARPSKLVETMPVYIFGYPLGDLLATNKRHPAITVGKGSVSSIRLTDSGDLATVQIDGDVTPGNSGGPVVDAQGRLVGVAAATVRGRRIGFAIPGATLTRLLHGQLLDHHFVTRRIDARTVEVRVELGLFDPLGRLRNVSFYHFPREAPGVKKLAGVAGVQQVVLAREPQQLAGKFNLDVPEGSVATVCFQAAWINGAGTAYFSNPRVRRFRVDTSRPVPPPFIVRPVSPPRDNRKPLDDTELTRLIADLRSSDGGRQKAAAERLTRAKPGTRRKEVAEALAPVMDSRDLFVRTSAAKAYIAWADKDGLPKLHEVLTKCDCFITRSIIVEALAKLEGVKAAEAIAAFLPNLVVKDAAVRALLAIGPGAEKAVLPYLEHKDWIARGGACLALKGLGTAACLPALEKAAGDVNGAVAAAARQAKAEVEKRVKMAAGAINIRQRLDRHLAGLKAEGGQVITVGDPALTRSFPGASVFVVVFKQPATALPAPLKARNVFVVGKEGAPRHAVEAGGLEALFRSELFRPAREADAVRDAARAWLVLTVQLQPDAAAYRIDDGSLTAAPAARGWLATGRAFALAGGRRKEILVRLTFNAAGGLTGRFTSERTRTVRP